MQEPHGLVGGLIGLGIPEDEAESYDNYVDEGRILVMVDADNTRAEEAYSVFRSHNSANADRYMDDNMAAGDVTGTARNSVTDTVDAAFNGSGLEGRQDTGLDTMNSAPVHDLPETRALDDVSQAGNDRGCIFRNSGWHSEFESNRIRSIHG